MSAEPFIDTNILVYAFSDDPVRSEKAAALLATGGVIGVQVLNEFTNVARRKLGWSWSHIESALDVIGDLLGPAKPLTAEIQSRACDIARDHQCAFYDALIISAALSAGCNSLCTEDLQHGQAIEGLIVSNPFLS
jgi:predicted nucleic acid-binding protein